MRGAHRVACHYSITAGIIPAYAGSTFKNGIHAIGQADHPRVCGEHVIIRKDDPDFEGSSPRMRGAQSQATACGTLTRIIPAYAGSTAYNEISGTTAKDHPRVCGEHSACFAASGVDEGSSPRMRGALSGSAVKLPIIGIIPAYAGSTWPRCPHPRTTRDHPRVCGEHAMCKFDVLDAPGSSPRMRGAHWYGSSIASKVRIIPAYAGSTVHSCNAVD